MQVKNASFFQLHIEKIILALGVLFLLIAVAVVVFGVIIKPYQVEVGNKTYDSPAEIIPVLEDEAEDLKGGLQPTGLEQPKQVPADYQVPDLETNYTQTLAQPIVDTQPLATLGSIGLLETDMVPDDVKPPSYTLPSPPMVADIEYKHGFEVLDDEDRVLADAYAELWGEAREPADFSYVFMEGTFDLGEWVERLQAAPAEGQRVPLGIWSQKLGLATVYLVREERDKVTGEWTNRTLVSLLPDQIGVVPGEEHPTDYEPQAYIEWYLAMQADIAQPAPPPLAGGGELLPPLDDPMMLIDPEELERMAEEEAAAERARRRAETEQRRAERAAERDARRNQNGGGGNIGPGDLGGPIGPGGRGGSSGRSGRGGGAVEPGSTGRGGRESSRPGRETTPLGPGRGIPGGLDEQLPGGRGGLGPAGPGRGGLGTPQEQELEEGVLRVWAVDVTVQPGTTYRYKLVVGVINPLYGVARLEESQLSENRNRAALLPSDEEIDAAPWIEPIEIEPSNQFYVVSANDRGARVNVWRVFNGERVKETFDVNPGDPIGGEVQIEDEAGIMYDVDMSVGATVVDIDRRRDINGQTVWTLIYIDDYGNLHERPLAEDQAASNQFERRLREEREARDRAMDMLPNNGGNPGEFGPGELGPGGPLGPGIPNGLDRTGR